MSLLERWFIALQEPPKTKRAEEFYYEQERQRLLKATNSITDKGLEAKYRTRAYGKYGEQELLLREVLEGTGLERLIRDHIWDPMEIMAVTMAKYGKLPMSFLTCGLPTAFMPGKSAFDSRWKKQTEQRRDVMIYVNSRIVKAGFEPIVIARDVFYPNEQQTLSGGNIFGTYMYVWKPMIYKPRNSYRYY